MTTKMKYEEFLTRLLETAIRFVLIPVVTLLILISIDRDLEIKDLEAEVKVESTETSIYAERIPVSKCVRSYIYTLPVPEENEEMVMVEASTSTENETSNMEYATDDDFVICLGYAEAGNQGIYGQKLVLETIRNRKDTEGYPDTMKEVCLDENQFSPIQDGVPTINGEQVTSECITYEMRQNFEEVMQGSNETEKLLKEAAYAQGLTDEKYWKGGALFFSNLDAISQELYEANNYDNIKVSVKVGDHTFWRYWG